MYQTLTNITVQQIPSDAYPDRNSQITIPYFHSYSGSSSWDELTSTMKIVLPKNVKLRFTNLVYGTYSMGSINQTIGGGASPTFLQGDMITINVGYRAKLMGNGGNEVTYMTGAADPTGTITGGIPPLFQGFISNVSPRLPFTLECEDAMWLLKQISTGDAAQYTATNIPSIVQQMISGTQAQALLGRYVNPVTKSPYFKLSISPYSLSQDVIFNIQTLLTHRESIAQVLSTLKTKYQIISYFRGYELRTGLTYYLPDDAVTQNFTFTQNILDGDSLAFKRLDDNIESIMVKSTYSMPAFDIDGNPIMTADGNAAMNSATTDVLVYVNDDGDYDAWSSNSPNPFPLEDSGKLNTWHLYGVAGTSGNAVDITDATNLMNIGIRLLKKRYYDGLTGSFTTFGVPYVKHGDVINLVHPILPDMNGMYMCRHVTYSGSSEEGLRQTITLDFSITDLDLIDAFS